MASRSALPATVGASHLRAHAGTILTMFAWGTLIPAAHVVLLVFDVWTLSTARVLIAAIALLGASIAVEGVAWLSTVHWVRIALLGAGVAGFSVLYTLGIALSDPVSAIIVAAAGPVVSAAFAAFVTKERLPHGTVGAFGFSTIGVIVASLAARSDAAHVGFRGGEVLLLLGSLCWTWYSIKAQLWLGPLGQHRITALSYGSAATILCLLYAALFVAGLAAPPRIAPSPTTWALFAWIIGAVTLMGGVFWNYGVSRIGIIFASLYLNLIPIFGILTAAAFGRYPTWQQILGCLLVLLGVSLLRRRRANDDIKP